MKIQDKIEDVVNTLVTSVNDTNKEYVTEKISLESKREQINCDVSVANFRLNNAVKMLAIHIVSRLKEERMSPNNIEIVKGILNEQL